MEFYILNTDFEPIFLVEEAESLIWTDRYCGYGDFEIYSPVNGELFDAAQLGNYVWFRNSSKLMIIDTVTITDEFESGAHLKITGKSLESLLQRRIIWHKTTFKGTVQAAIRQAIFENAIGPSDKAREMPYLRFYDHASARINDMKVECQATGTNLYDFVIQLCQEHDIGFQITYLEELKIFAFSLIIPTDRSYEQIDRPYVVFSNEFENLYSSNYYDSVENMCNVALVAGEDVEGKAGQTTKVKIDKDENGGDIVTIITNESSDNEKQARRTVTVPVSGVASGLERRELYVDARDIQSELEDDKKMSDADYAKLLVTRGMQKLNEVKEETLFEGEVEPNLTFRYGEDYFLGDIVQLRNEFSIEGRARISEIVWTHDANGETMIPTFELVD